MKWLRCLRAKQGTSYLLDGCIILEKRNKYCPVGTAVVLSRSPVTK
jgi:hypothetical protein